MSDRRVVQCFGIKKRPKKEDMACHARFLWTAAALGGNFGSKGTQACPKCGTLPDFRHPVNQWLSGDITEDEALNLLNSENKT